VILLICYNHWLIKEPVKENPFTLAYKVLKYAVKHKHPQCRSAFTYCEDELPSRIDFGKRKYGGPFTTEQVEDVKTFLRLIPMGVVGGALAGGLYTTNVFRDKLMNLTTSEAIEFGSSISVSLKECFIQSSFGHTVYYSAVLLIVLHETIFYPVFQRCLPQIESLQKVLIGILLQIARVLVLITYIVILRHTSKEQLHCLFTYADNDHSSAQIITFSHYWIVIPDFLQALSTTMLLIGAAEFLSAQVPHFMKGLMIGMSCCFLVISSAICFVLSIPFTKSKLTIWGSGTISCGFWFSLIIAVTLIVLCPILAILIKWYKKRRRQDVLPNEHIFAEKYYSTDS
jgi:peptide/histidine transporter 3/4